MDEHMPSCWDGDAIDHSAPVTNFLILLSITGTVGNSFVLYVYWYKKDRQTSSTLILVLACADLITCTILIPLAAYLESVQCRVLLDVVCKSYHFLNATNIPFSALVMALIAVDRYLNICHPWTKVLNPGRVKRVVCVLALCSASIGFVVALMHGVYQNGFYYEYTNGSKITDGLHLTNDTRPMAESLLNSQSETNDWHPPQENDLNYNQEKEIVHVKKYPGIMYSGDCGTNEIIIGYEFRDAFQIFLYIIYASCLIVIIILYFLLYRGVLHLRQRQKSREAKVKLSKGSRSIERNANAETQRINTAREKSVKTQTVERKTGLLVKKISNPCLKAATLRTAFRNYSSEMKQQESSIDVSRRNLSLNDIHHSTRSRVKVVVSPSLVSLKPPNVGSSTLPDFNMLCVSPNVERWRSAKVSNVFELGSAEESLWKTESGGSQSGSQQFMEEEEEEEEEARRSSLKHRATVLSRTLGKNSVRRSSRKAVEQLRLNNLKTAAILSTVALVFFVTYIPSLLMSLDLLEHIRLVHYLYFTNNVANPFIYSFMNKNFRRHVKMIFYRRFPWRSTNEVLM